MAHLPPVPSWSHHRSCTTGPKSSRIPGLPVEAKTIVLSRWATGVSLSMAPFYIDPMQKPPSPQDSAARFSLPMRAARTSDSARPTASRPFCGDPQQKVSVRKINQLLFSVLVAEQGGALRIARGLPPHDGDGEQLRGNGPLRCRFELIRGSALDKKCRSHPRIGKASRVGVSAHALIFPQMPSPMRSPTFGQRPLMTFANGRKTS
jgi:hypothetical protein